MNNLYINSTSNINKYDVDLVKKIKFFLIRKVSKYNNIQSYFSDNNVKDRLATRRKKISDLILNNNFIQSNQDEHYIKIIYAHDENISNSKLLKDVKDNLASSKIIPNIIQIETEETISSSVSLTFEYHISDNYINWLLNDISIEIISEQQLKCINSNLSELLTNKKQIIGNTQASAFGEDVNSNIEIINELLKQYNQDTGIPNSLIIAQFIEETHKGTSELFRNANNCFGIKTLVPYHRWFGSIWDENMIYRKESIEYNRNGKPYKKVSNFRKYNSVDESIVDYINYLLNSKRGIKPRYEGIDRCKDYKEACHIVGGNGYATFPNYERELLGVIKSYGLTKYDEKR